MSSSQYSAQHKKLARRKAEPHSAFLLEHEANLKRMEAIYRNIMSKLLKLGMVTDLTLVEGSIILGTGRQRNRFFYVKNLKGQSFFLKQPSGEPNAKNSLFREARFYQLVSTMVQLNDLNKIIPKFICFDPEDSLIVLELLDSSRSLSLLHSNEKCFDHSLLTAFGASAALIHSISTYHFLDTNNQFDFDGMPHWIIRLKETPSPLKSLRNRSRASSLLVDELLADDKIMSELSRQLDRWRATHLIHGDYKWENAIVLDDQEPSLCITDWENVNLGDPAWDVAYGLAAILVNEILTSKIESIQINCPPIIKAMQAFWKGYLNHQSCCMEDIKYFLRRAIDMMATRLIIVAFELCYAEDEIPALATGIVQIAHLLYGDGIELIANAIEGD